MRIVFFGTPSFAASILERLSLEGFTIPLVVCREDKPRGRSKKLVPPEVKVVAEKLSLPVAQPRKASDPSFIQTLKEQEADVFVVVAYGEILRQEVLDLPKMACINVHASLLPEYRGASPIQQAVLDGREKTGVTIMHMVKSMDAGNVIDKAEVSIGSEETAGELEEVLCHVGQDLLVKVLQDSGGIGKGVPQREELATYVKKIHPADAQIDFSAPAIQVHNLIRGMNPKPGAYAEMVVKGSLQRVKIFRSKLADVLLKKCEIFVDRNRLLIGCGDGQSIEVVQMQLPGKKVMTAKAFLSGVEKNAFYFP